MPTTYSVLLIFLLVVGMRAHADPLVLQDERSYSLEGYLEILGDARGNLSFAEVLSQPVNEKFAAIEHLFAGGYASGAVWVRFQLQRSSAFPETAYLRLGPSVLDFVTVYLQSAADPVNPEAYLIYRLGDRVPIDPHAPTNPDFVAPLRLPPELPLWIYIRVQSSSLLNLTGAVDTLVTLSRHSNRIILLQSAWLSIALLIAMAALLFYLRLHDRLYGYYALYMLALFVNRISVAGMLPLIWPTQAHRLSEGCVAYGGTLALVFLILFSIKLFAPVLTASTRMLFRLMLTVMCTVVLLVPFVRWEYLGSTTIASGFFLCGLQSWVAFQAARRGEGGGWLYCGAFVTMFVAFGTQLLRVSGLLPVAWWNVHTFQFGAFTHMQLLVAALAERLRCLEQSALTTERRSKLHAEHLAAEMTVELRQKQRDLERTLERQAHFVAMVSHEYRTPLAIIRTNLDLLSMMKSDPEGNLAFAVGKMKRAVSRLVEVLEISLGKAKLAEEALRARTEPVALLRFVADTVDQARDFWPERKLLFQTDAAAGAVVPGDQALMKTALLNVLDNAVKYSPAESAVEVCAGIEDGQAIIRVTDSGIGIAREQLERVFEKYYRIPGNQAVSGAGIGLYLVARIVEEHRGSVAIENSRRGTTVTIRLPLFEEARIDNAMQ